MPKLKRLEAPLSYHSQQLCYFLLRQGSSVKRLADEIDCAETTVWNWIDARCVPQPRYRQKLEDVTGLLWPLDTTARSSERAPTASNGATRIDATATGLGSSAEIRRRLDIITSMLVAVLSATDLPGRIDRHVGAAAQLFVEELMAADARRNSDNGSNGSAA